MAQEKFVAEAVAEAVDTEVRTSQGTCPKTVLVKVVAGENKLDGPPSPSSGGSGLYVVLPGCPT